MVWLKLTVVQLISLNPKKPKELSTIVRQSRVNMSSVDSYFQSSDEQRNHASEDARFNSILDTGKGYAFFVKESVDEIDNMLGLTEVKVPDTVATVEASHGWGAKDTKGWMT